MRCSELAARIEAADPQAEALDVARMCTLISTAIQDRALLNDDQFFHDAWCEMNGRLAAASDQHAAVTDELKNLADSDPCKFKPEQIWILIRAIKIQNQVLQMYVGDPEMDLG